MTKAEARIERELLSAQGLKRCTNKSCRKIQFVKNFSANSQNPDGLAYYCRSCHSNKVQQAKKDARERSHS